jgi:phenylacetate-CoA ligase
MYADLYRGTRLLYPNGIVKHQRLQKLEKTQWFSLDELKAWQFMRIKALLKYAYEHVPYYRELYQRMRIRPEDIRDFEDFQNLPFITKEDINNNLDLFVSPKLRTVALPNSTGGSTGQPMQFYSEQAFSYWDNALELRGRGWYGVHEGDKTAWIWGAARDMHNSNWKARLKAMVLRERYLNAFDMTEKKMESFAGMLIRWQPKMFRAYASALSLFAHFIENNKITGIRPRLIETTAEKVTNTQREFFEKVFQCPVGDWYTARELGTIAFQCPKGGLHVSETRYLEVVANGQPVEPGQLGEVVITSTHQFAMPLIRYKLGDMAIYETQPCSCGRGLPVLREVVGRIQDFLVTADGHFVHGGYFPYTFPQWPEISQYQVYQPDMQHIEVRLTCRSDVDSLWLNNVHDELQNRFGKDMRITIKIVDHFELTRAGKHRFIISDVKPDFID